MGKVESTIRSEILRLARKEVRSAFIPLKRDLRIVRLTVSSLKKSLAALDRAARERTRTDGSGRLQIEASPEEVKSSRFTPQRIRILRERLGISQKQLAALARVSIGAVGSWEKGKFEPKAAKKAILLGLRKLKRRGVKKLLAEMKEAPGERKKNKEQRAPRRQEKTARRDGRR
jgi:DNA-binding transcriptional regulator YiaG